MEALEALYTRRSIKAFTDEMPSQADIDKITKAGMAAPTGMGAQSPLIVVVKNKAVRDELSKMNAEVMGTHADPFYNAPVIIVVLADKTRGTYMYDGSLVMGNMLNAPRHRTGCMLDSPCQGSVRQRAWQSSAQGMGHRR